MIETLTAIDQQNNETRAVLPAESTHFYFKDGRPCYRVPYADPRKGMRDTNLSDARKLDLVPSVTEILNVAAKPGLEAWKAKQILEASLTLPRKLICEVINGKAVTTEESLDDYAVRVVEDSKSQSKKAMERGTQLHAAIEDWIKGQSNQIWGVHIEGIVKALEQLGIDLTSGKAEHSFASPLGYGGKIDFHNDEPLVCDFKTKDFINDKKPLAYENHVQQLAAYGHGLWHSTAFRGINVFIGVNDKQVRVVEHTWKDLAEGFYQFQCLLEYWHRVKKFGKYSKP